MRRSCAPSMKGTLFQNNVTVKAINDENKVSSSSDCYVGANTWGRKAAHRGVNNFKESDKIFYNIVWREFTNKKHKTWKGDGTLEISSDGSKAVLKDEAGKYMGSTTSFKISQLEEGFQMSIGGKEIELQEQIKDIHEVFARRKLHSGWGAEDDEEVEPPVKRPKGQFVFQPNLVLTTPKMQPLKPVNMREEQKTTCDVKPVEPLILPTPPDTPNNKYNKLNRPVHEVRVVDSLTKSLRPHQRDGVRFLYDCLMGFRTPHQHGVILADEMGLGKTLQCLTVAHTLLSRGPFGGERILQRVLIVTPSSLTETWNNEINKWLSKERMYAFVVDGKHALRRYSQQSHIPFVIVSYETFLAHTNDFQQLDFDLLVCDEGHRFKNNETKIFTALRGLQIQRRVLLTGTPIQNDLQEFYALADFVNPGIFGTYSEFRTHYELPIVHNQNPDASAEVLQLGSERSAELNEVSGEFLLRRSQSINRQYLPKKREYVVFVRPSELQQFMFRKTLELYENRKKTILSDLTPLQIITVLKKICNHPSLIARTKTPNLLTRNLERSLPNWSEMGPFDSSKLELVQNFLTATIGPLREKVVIVSNHTKTLNMLQGLCDHLNIKILRLDGSTPAAERNSIVDKFNTNSGIDAELVFLISSKAGGVGLNLCGASRLILFDNDWNPATDAQAMSRVWRDGQQQDVQIYRLITAGTIEEKIFQRQMAKLSLGGYLLGTDEKVKFSIEELADVFTLQEDFTICQTHEALKCNCNSEGKNPLGQVTNMSDERQINELMKWNHHGAPLSKEFLRAACLEGCSENILYVFSQ